MSTMSKKEMRKMPKRKSGSIKDSAFSAFGQTSVRVKASGLGKAVQSIDGDSWVDVTIVEPTRLVVTRAQTSNLGLLAGRPRKRALALAARNANGKFKIIKRLTQRMEVAQAEDWYRHHRIPAFGHRTSSQLVRLGMIDAVLSYIDGLDSGAFV